jgi:predicted nucleic acid-binding protein
LRIQKNQTMPIAPERLVIDTNVALDLLVFNEPAHAALMAPLRHALQTGRAQWLACPPMRDELARVLHYPKLAPRVAFYGHTDQTVLAAYDAWVQMQPVPARAAFACSDADDQVFIDLACAHRTPLLSKDAAVLRMKKRLASLGVTVCTVQDCIAQILRPHCGRIAND